MWTNVVRFDMLPDVEMIIMDPAVIDLGFLVGVFIVDVLTGVYDIGIDVLVNMSVNGLAAEMTDLEFALPAA